MTKSAFTDGFCQACQTVKVHYTGSVEPENGVNKNVCDAKLLSTTILVYPMDYICFYHLLKHSIAACVLMEGVTCLQLPILPYHPLHPPPTPLYMPLMILL